MRSRMIVFLMALLLQSQPLFTISRSTNANVVHYDARLMASGSLDPTTPIVGYWIMLAEHGQREEFSGSEKKAAYGFTVMKERSSDCYRMTLAANTTRPIQVCSDHGSVRAEVTIDGHSAVLERMFIDIKGAAFWKSVEHIELFGTDAETGARLDEQIKPR